MTAVTAPGGRRSLAGKLIGVAASRSQPGSRRRLAAFASAAREHVGTAAACAAADLGGFQVFHHGGWFVVAVSLVLLDFAVRG